MRISRTIQPGSKVFFLPQSHFINVSADATGTLKKQNKLFNKINMFNKQYTMYNYSFSYMKICKISKKKKKQQQKSRILSFLVVCLFPFRPSIILFIDTYASFSIFYNYQVFLQVWFFFAFYLDLLSFLKVSFWGGGGGERGGGVSNLYHSKFRAAWSVKYGKRQGCGG